MYWAGQLAVPGSSSAVHNNPRRAAPQISKNQEQWLMKRSTILVLIGSLVIIPGCCLGLLIGYVRLAADKGLLIVIFNDSGKNLYINAGILARAVDTDSSCRIGYPPSLEFIVVTPDETWRYNLPSPKDLPGTGDKVYFVIDQQGAIYYARQVANQSFEKLPKQPSNFPLRPRSPREPKPNGSGPVRLPETP